MHEETLLHEGSICTRVIKKEINKIIIKVKKIKKKKKTTDRG